jgi:hypothetical protein
VAACATGYVLWVIRYGSAAGASSPIAVNLLQITVFQKINCID